MVKKRLNNLILVITTLAMLFSSFALMGCHKHDYTYSTYVAPPTCYRKGFTEHMCECGDILLDNETDLIPHEPEEVAEVPVSCMKDGVGKGYRCVYCKQTLGGFEPVYSDLKHNMVDGECTVCGKKATGGFNYGFIYEDAEETSPVSVYMREIVVNNPTPIVGDILLAETVRNSKFEGRQFPVIEIKENAFLRACEGITSFFIRESMEKIEYGAFRYCTALQKIAVSNSNTSLSSVRSTLYNKTQTLLICCPQQHFDTAFTVIDGVQEICDYAFANNKKITQIILPNSLVKIGDYAFENCVNIADVYYKDSETKMNNILVGSLGNDKLSNANWYFYSESQTAGGWRYVDGIPTKW